MKNEVRLGSKVHSLLLKAAAHHPGRENHHYIYLLGKSKRKNIIQGAVLLKTNDNGCSYMPSVTAESLHKAYVSLIRKKLIPCGMARVSQDLPADADWVEDCGFAVAECGEFMLSIDTSHVIAHRAINVHRSTDENGTDEYVSDYDVETLPISITDK